MKSAQRLCCFPPCSGPIQPEGRCTTPIYVGLQTKRHLGISVLCPGRREEGSCVRPPPSPCNHHSWSILGTSAALTLYQQYSTHQEDTTGQIEAQVKTIFPQPTILQSCSDSASQMICCSSKEKGVLQKQHSTNLITACCCLSPHNGSASRPGCPAQGLDPWGSARWEAGESLEAQNTARACNRQEIQQQGHPCSLPLRDAW